MATVKESSKGFKLLETTVVEIVQVGGIGICDYCNRGTDRGIYIAAMNNWYCPKCFEEWHNRAVRYEEDAKIEERNFLYYQKVFEKINQ